MDPTLRLHQVVAVAAVPNGFYTPHRGDVVLRVPDSQNIEALKGDGFLPTTDVVGVYQPKS
jgi:hypothetical protein